MSRSRRCSSGVRKACPALPGLIRWVGRDRRRAPGAVRAIVEEGEEGIRDRGERRGSGGECQRASDIIPGRLGQIGRDRLHPASLLYDLSLPPSPSTPALPPPVQYLPPLSCLTRRPLPLSLHTRLIHQYSRQSPPTPVTSDTSTSLPLLSNRPQVSALVTLTDLQLLLFTSGYNFHRPYRVTLESLGTTGVLTSFVELCVSQSLSLPSTSGSFRHLPCFRFRFQRILLAAGHCSRPCVNVIAVLNS